MLRKILILAAVWLVGLGICCVIDLANPSFGACNDLMYRNRNIALHAVWLARPCVD